MNLTEEFGAPPFTVLDARQGYWQKRKRQWLQSGISSEQGRGKDLMGFSGTCTSLGHKDTSIFDPVLCEILIRWFSPFRGLMRANRFFTGSRKMVKTHQNVLVFVKGSWKKATQRMKFDYRQTWDPEPEIQWLPGLNGVLTA